MSSRYVLKVVDVHGQALHAEGPASGYVLFFDADHPMGEGASGQLVLTHKLEEAMTFDSAKDALEFYRTQSKTVPLRPDGQPNCPLTAFSVEIECADVP